MVAATKPLMSHLSAVTCEQLNLIVSLSPGPKFGCIYFDELYDLARDFEGFGIFHWKKGSLLFLTLSRMECFIYLFIIPFPNDR